MKSNRENFLLGRQPILNREQEIIGFELLFRSPGADRADFESYSHASASVITSALSDFGIHEVLGGKRGFINVHLGLLLSEMLELLPINGTVLELLEIIELDASVVERCHELKQLGFTLALDDHVFDPKYADIYETVDIVKIDILQTDPAGLPEIVRQLRHWPLKLVAEKVETVEQFKLCHSLGFDLFQGYFFERPEVLNKKGIDISGMAILKLLQQLTIEAKISEIEQTFRENPGLSYNLLQLVNSVSVGTREKIKTLRHAIVMLGRSQLRRWIHLSLFAGKDSRGVNHPLLEMAAVRGRMLEILVSQKGTSTDKAEAAFMTGILSLLDVLFEIPMEDLVPKLNLTEEINQALLLRQGGLGSLLSLVEKLEATDFNAAAPLLRECQVSPDQLLAAQLEAFKWRENAAAI